MNESRAAPEVPQSRRSPEGPPAERDASSRLLQFVTDRVPAMIGYWDSALRNRFGNKAYLEWFGLTPEQMRGRHIREVIGEDLFAKNRPFLEGALTGVPQHFDRTIVDAAGRTRHTQASYLPDVDDSGRIQGLVALVTDVTERVRVERQLAEREQLQRAILDGSPIGLAVVELDGRWSQVNPALCRLLGYSPEQMMSGMTFQDITHPDDLDADLALAARLLDGTLDSYELEKRYLHADGHEVWIQMHGSLIRDEEGRPLRFVAQVVDVSQLRAQQAELQRRADTDPLTGLANRRVLDERLALALAGLQRADPEERWVGVLLVDLDGFKPVNDRYGHAAGDALLKQVAERLRHAVRVPDLVARLGGDEFVVVTPGHRHEGDVRRLVGRVAAALDLPYELEIPGGRAVRVDVGASIGLALATTGDLRDPAAMLRDADTAMYVEKLARRA